MKTVVLKLVEIINILSLFVCSHATYGFPMLVNHRKWRIGEYLVTYTLFVTLLAEFLVEIASELGPRDCDCSGSESDTVNPRV